MTPIEILHQVVDQDTGDVNRVSMLKFPDGRRFGYQVTTDDAGRNTHTPAPNGLIDALSDTGQES